jgi:hypothetical protein
MRRFGMKTEGAIIVTFCIRTGTSGSAVNLPPHLTLLRPNASHLFRIVEHVPVIDGGISEEE